jgi:hypothetical protein
LDLRATAASLYPALFTYSTSRLIIGEEHSEKIVVFSIGGRIRIAAMWVDGRARFPSIFTK